MAQILDGTALAKKIKNELKERIEQENIKACLAVVLVGDDPASRIYVNGKKNDCKEIGIESREIALPASTTEGELLGIIDELNKDNSVNGILVQLPLPKAINEKVIINAINPKKDVDGFHPMTEFTPCTPGGIMEFFAEYDIPIEGKNCVVIGRSNIVGKPMARLLLNANGTVTVCHSKTKNLSEYTKNADILVAAIGKPEFVTTDMVKEGAVVIDVGMDRLPDGKLVGDVDFENVKEKASYITPVPGGVGPMTRAELMKNVVEAIPDF